MCCVLCVVLWSVAYQLSGDVGFDSAHSSEVWTHTDRPRWALRARTGSLWARRLLRASVAPCWERGPHTELRGPASYQHSVIQSAQRGGAASITAAAALDRHGGEKTCSEHKDLWASVHICRHRSSHTAALQFKRCRATFTSQQLKKKMIWEDGAGAAELKVLACTIKRHHVDQWFNTWG